MPELPCRGIDAEAGRRALTAGRDSLQVVVVGEVVDPARPGRQVADEVEDLLARGVHFGA